MKRALVLLKVEWNCITPQVGCSRLVKARGQVGVYRLVCWPKCVHRRDPITIARIAQRVTEQGGDSGGES